MARQATYEQKDFLEAALAYIDEYGSEALTTRTLGASVGASHATVYRHFGSKEELLGRLIDDQMGMALSNVNLDSDPIEVLFSISISIRDQFAAHPNLLRPFINSDGVGPNVSKITKLSLESLFRLGVSKGRVTFWLRILENVLFGSLVFDYASAPNHLQIRSQRLNSLSNAASLGQVFTEKDVEKENEDAFIFSMKTVLSSLEVEVKNGA